MKEGDKLKSMLTGKIYELKAVKDWVTVLKSLDGTSQVWTEKDNLKLFYEKLEDAKIPEHLTHSPAKPKRLRSPAAVTIDFP